MKLLMPTIMVLALLSGCEAQKKTPSDKSDTTETKSDKEEESSIETSEVENVDVSITTSEMNDVNCIDRMEAFGIDSTMITTIRDKVKDTMFAVNTHKVEGHEAVFEIARDTVLEHMKEMLVEYRSMFEPGEYCHDEENREDISCQWDYESNIHAHYVGEEIESLMSYTYLYAGGAHGNLYYRSFNFKNGEPVELSNLVDGARMEALEDMVIERLKEQGASDAHYKEELDLTKYTFVFDPEGIEFHFAPYEVGSYAEGTFCARVEWKEIGI